MNVLPPVSCLWKPDPAWGIYAYFWWVLLACMAGQLLDVVLAWRKFAKKEEEMEERRREEEGYYDDEPEACEGIMERQPATARGVGTSLDLPHN
jgi:hypothetical protein